MKIRITSVQLAILDGKASQAAKLNRRRDELTRSAYELLEIDLEKNGPVSDYVNDFLDGQLGLAELVELLGIEVVS